MAGTLTISNLSDGTNTGSVTDAIKGSAKAWVNIAGFSGTVRGSFNVSSVLRNGTGDYTINFTNAFSDTNWAASAIARRNTAGTNIAQVEFAANSTSINTYQCQLKVFDNGNTSVDGETVMAVFFR